MFFAQNPVVNYNLSENFFNPSCILSNKKNFIKILLMRGSSPEDNIPQSDHVQLLKTETVNIWSSIEDENNQQHQ